MGRQLSEMRETLKTADSQLRRRNNEVHLLREHSSRGVNARDPRP